MPGGRPTDYDPAYCDTAVEILSKGYSETVLAGELDVCPATVANWKNAHPEFLEAVKRGRAKGVRVWEDRLMDNAKSGTGNATSCIFGLKNRASEDWRDKTEQELSGTLHVEKTKRVICDPGNPDR